MIERGRGGREVRRPPVARTDRDQGLEGGGPRRERGRDDEGVGTAPAGADQRAFPAMLLQRGCVARQGVQAVVIIDCGVAAVARPDLIGDVPKKLWITAGAMSGQLRLLENGKVLEPIGH